MTEGRKNIPPDQVAREKILVELDKTLLVEAAAGTGKTTSMAGRMVALLRERKCAIDEMAAITFTRKAAAELRSRFQTGLERAVRAEGGLVGDMDEMDAMDAMDRMGAGTPGAVGVAGPEGAVGVGGPGREARPLGPSRPFRPSRPSHEALASALEHIERCFIGTIHSFCARLLRERPIEAGVDVNFREIDAADDETYRQEAWDETVAALIARDDPILRELSDVGLDVGQLSGAFRQFAEYPDVDEWPARRVALPDLGPAIAALRDYASDMQSLAPQLGDGGNDKLIAQYQSIPRIVGQLDLSDPAQLMEALERFGSNSIVHKQWPGGKEQALAEQARWNQFKETYCEPLLTAWREKRYEIILRVLKPAAAAYDHLRQERGVLNYQDLLMKAARLLRGAPHVRQYFRRRFPRLLIDEFQDTDPVQAEVMMLLTADDAAQRDWRNCRPVPGSLFVVGDPKQSIYRFRRADIAIYNEVKDIIRGSGGEIVTLSANFRAIAPIVHWVNERFAQAFGEFPEGCSPDYVPLDVGRAAPTAPRDADSSPIQLYEVPISGRAKAPIVGAEAEAIAQTIRHALDASAKLSPSANQTGPSIPSIPSISSIPSIPPGKEARAPAQPSDFMIVTRRKNTLTAYGHALQRLGVPHQITGGGALSDVAALELLHLCLAALVEPDNPVALLAVLRSELFGVSDADLYDFKRRGGQFAFSAAVPEGLDRPAAEVFNDAFVRLRRYALWLSAMPPVAAMERIAADVGLFVLAAASPGGNMQAGGLAKALELLRAAQADKAAVAELVEYLGALIAPQSPEEHDGLPAAASGAPAVRLMNLHKAKGLEAPFVFLADPTGGGGRHPVAIHVERAASGAQERAASGGQTLGYMGIYERSGAAGEFGSALIAQPPQWEKKCELEEQFLKAEELRLLYVAATRAGSQLTISQRQGNKYQTENFWSFFTKEMAGAAQMKDPGERRSLGGEGHPLADEDRAPAGQPLSIAAGDIQRAAEAIAQRWRIARRPTYGVEAAKAVSLARRPIAPPIDGAATSAESEGQSDETGEAGETGAKWGAVIHALLECAMRESGAGLRPLAEALLSEQELPPDLIGEALATVRAVMDSEIWRRASRSPRRFVEAPFERLATARQLGLAQAGAAGESTRAETVRSAGFSPYSCGLSDDPRIIRAEARTPNGLLQRPAKDDEAALAADAPIILRGVIDLVFWEDGGWVIVDYKTDAGAEKDLAALAAHYSPQVKLYADSWREITAAPVRETGLYFIRANKYVLC